MDRILVWRGVDEWRAEVCRVALADGSLTATGTQIGVTPMPYRLDYQVSTTDQWITRRLEVEVVGDTWWRRLALSHDGRGGWTAQADLQGDVELPRPGGDCTTLTDALDCDLGLSPLTNTMPILRHAVHTRGATPNLAMAWVSVPDLGVHRSAQTYEHVRRSDGDAAVVRFRSDDGDFVSDLTIDADGLVLDYPQLAALASADSDT